MKFLYRYRTSDNQRKAGEIVAANREAVFAMLKERGIRPERVDEAPGVCNRLFGKGKRWLAIAMLSLAVVALATCLLLNRGDVATARVLDVIGSSTRRQIIGDSAVIEQGIATGWSEVFPLAGDRFLASFAVPGCQAAVRSTSVEEMEKALSQDVEFRAEDGIEVRQIKSIVAGMKDELRSFLVDGGTIVEYGALLVKRQEQEISYRDRATHELEVMVGNGASEDAIQSRRDTVNRHLRGMGIRPLPSPENGL